MKNALIQSKFKTQIFETALNTRAFDKKLELLGKIMDYDNQYNYVNERGNKATNIPYKWVVLDVLENMAAYIDTYTTSSMKAKEA